MTISEPRVLIVDDDIEVCDNVADILKDLGYETDTAPSIFLALSTTSWPLADRNVSPMKARSIPPSRLLTTRE